MSKKPGDVLPGLIPLYGNYYAQVGRGAFANNGTDTTINTQLESVVSGQASWTTSSATASDGPAALAMESDVSSATIALHRSGNTAALADLTDGEFTYMVVGTIDLTD